jgi:hypothetical protein
MTWWFHLLPPQFSLYLLRFISGLVAFPPGPLQCLHHLSPVRHSCGSDWSSRSNLLPTLSGLSDSYLGFSSSPSSSFYWIFPGISDIVSCLGGPSPVSFFTWDILENRWHLILFFSSDNARSVRSIDLSTNMSINHNTRVVCPSLRESSKSEWRVTNLFWVSIKNQTTNYYLFII